MFKRLVAITLALVMFIGLVPTMSNIITSSAEGALPNGTVIYYEDFNYANTAGNSNVLSTLGWSLAEEYRTNTATYSISGGKLLCDSTGTSATTDSYVTVLDDSAMSEVVKGDYTIAYKLNYVTATDYTKYSCLVYNYNGYKSYNTANVRIAGFGYNQVRAYSWYSYDDSASSYYMPSTNANSIAYKLFGVYPATTTASVGTSYPMVGRELTVRIAVDVDAGATVYVNGIKVSAPSKYKELFMSSQVYASAIALKNTAGVKAYMDDFVVYTGLGDIPLSLSKDEVSYTPPQSPYDSDTTIKAMSYNVYYISQSTVALSDGLNRTTHLYNVINGYHPDIVGFQERTEANKTGITNLLTNNTHYKVVDEYRTDTNVSYVHHHAPIMYNTDRLTPEANTAANNYMGHGALLFKDCYEVRNLTATQRASFSPGKSMSWAVFKDNDSGSYVLAMNTHFSLYLSTYTNYTRADAINDRLSNASECLGIMKKVFAVYGSIPVIYTGDFNMYSFDPAYKYITEQLSDTLHAKDEFIKYEYSMGSITTPSLVEVPDLPIDHIFYSPEALTAIGYEVGNRSAEIRIASDHFPIISKFIIEKAAAPRCSHITGVYNTAQSVVLSGAEEIYYTVDGSDPRSSDTRKLYPGVISVTKDTVLKYCAYKNGAYSNVKRVTLYFGNPIYITEVTKNSPGTDFYEGIEVINVSSVPLDLFDFVIWNYSDAVPSSWASFPAADVILQMKMASAEGQYVIPSGGVAFCPTVNSTMYMNKDALSAAENNYLVTLNDDGTRVTYHTDRFAKAIAYDGSGNIDPEMIFVIDRTARSMGYSENGTLVKRADYYSSDGATVNNLYRSFNLSNSAYTRLYITLSTAQYATEALTVCELDTTDGGTTTADDGSTTVLEGSYHFIPSNATLMSTQSFTKSAYSIGGLNETQKAAFDKIISARRGNTAIAISTAEEYATMNANGSYYLAADISISKSYSSKFTGILDGNGHTVTTSVPLFADLSGTVKNLVIKGEIKGNGAYNGAVAPKSTSGARLENITVNASLSGGAVTGGLIGYVTDGSTITAADCVNYNNIHGANETGGLFGFVSGTKLIVDGCINKGKISSDTYCGGLVARFGIDASTIGYFCNITNSANYGEVMATSSRAGGILAYSAGNTRIAGCINYGYVHFSTVNTNSMAGGIYGAGSTTYTTSSGTSADTVNAFEITDCHNYGMIEATTNAGGIVGRGPNHNAYSSYRYAITACSNNGRVVMSDAGSTYSTKGAGGIVGYIYGGYSNNGNGVYNCYNTGDVSVNGGESGVIQRACGIAAFISGTTSYLKNCYNAGVISASGNNAEAYQLYCNTDSTGSSSSYINNNHSLSVSGVAYELNGTQTASYKTFTASELKVGTVKDRLNNGAGKICYYQSANLTHPVLKQFDNHAVNSIILKDNAVYTEDGEMVYKVFPNTFADSFKENFYTKVKVFDKLGNQSDIIPVATGWHITSYDGSKLMTIIVIGDIDGNGMVSATDYINLRNYMKTNRGLNKLQLNAADANFSGEVSAADYVTIKLMLSKA